MSELFVAHRRVDPRGRGRRWTTTTLNRAIVLNLAAEFQGFSRDLHDLAIQEIHTACSPPAVAELLRSLASSGRELDKGNAHPGALAKDFQRVSVDLWGELRSTTSPARRLRAPEQSRWDRHRSAASPDSTADLLNLDLDKLNAVRNAIAHSELSMLDRLRREGYPVTLLGCREWQRSLSELAELTDDVVSSVLAGNLGRRPW